MKNNASLIYNVCLVLGDFLALVAAFVGAYVLRVSLSNEPIHTPIPAVTYLGIFVSLLPFWILIFALLGLYNSQIYEKRFAELGRLLIGSFIGLLFVIFWSFFSTKPIFPAKLVPIYGFVLAFLFLVIFRNLARLIRVELFAFNVGLTRTLVIGNTSVSTELLDLLADSRNSGYRVVGAVATDKTRGKHREVPLFHTFHNAIEALSGKRAVHTIIQTELYADEDRNREILEYAQAHHIAYKFAPGNTELFVGNLDVELFRSSLPVINVHQTALIGWGRVVKGVFDRVVALLVLIVVSPVLLIISLLIAFSGGDVFFRQTRLTRYNREFKVFKFRTVRKKFNGMTPEEAFTVMGQPGLAEEFRANGDFLEHDPRFSKVGNFLRATSLDELPQLFNVLRGDLSLVGPRTLIPQELSVYDKRHMILSVKSGITGLAQVSGRKNISFEERRKLDIYYVQNWSFWLDLVILAKTVRVILQGS